MGGFKNLCLSTVNSLNEPQIVGGVSPMLGCVSLHDWDHHNTSNWAISVYLSANDTKFRHIRHISHILQHSYNNNNHINTLARLFPCLPPPLLGTVCIIYDECRCLRRGSGGCLVDHGSPTTFCFSCNWIIWQTFADNNNYFLLS